MRNQTINDFEHQLHLDNVKDALALGLPRKKIFAYFRKYREEERKVIKQSQHKDIKK